MKKTNKKLTKLGKDIFSLIFIISTMTFVLNMDKLIVLVISLVLSFTSYLIIDFY